MTPIMTMRLQTTRAAPMMMATAKPAGDDDRWHDCIMFT